MSNKRKNRLDALINAALLSGGNGAEGLIQQLNTLEKELEILERHPVVIGFGDWRYENSSPNIETRFGWVIQPRLTGNQDLVGDPEFRQVSDHYSLSAVISIPSWWNEIKVQIDKCWLKTIEFSAPDSSLCKSNNAQQSSSFTIRIPGTTRDIHQKLGFEVIKTPYMFPSNQQQIFEVGRPAAVLLEGVRLWRSTVVMLDNQKADSIEVLPDMKAVLAKFTCLKPAASSCGIMETYLYDDSSFPKTTSNSPSEKTGNPTPSTQPQTADQQSAEATNNQSNPNSNLPNNKAYSPFANSGTNIKIGCMSMSGSQSQQSNIQNGCIANVRLWTSEGNTSSNPLQVVLKPFVQRYVGDAPCYAQLDLLKTAGENTSQASH